MTAVVIDASAGAEIVSRTVRGRALARLIPKDAEGWVPEHFYAEVLSVLRRQLLIKKLTDQNANASVSRLTAWRLHRVSLPGLIPAAWGFRDNLTAADALYVVLADLISADLLTDDHRLANAPTLPPNLTILTLGVQR